MERTVQNQHGCAAPWLRKLPLPALPCGVHFGLSHYWKYSSPLTARGNACLPWPMLALQNRTTCEAGGQKPRVKIFFHEIRVLKLCRTGEKAEKNSGKEQIIKLSFLWSLVLRYLFLNFVLSQIWMLCKLFYMSSYYPNVNCIDLNVLMNESWGCQQVGIWLLWGTPQDRNHLSKPKVKNLRMV